MEELEQASRERLTEIEDAIRRLAVLKYDFMICDVCCREDGEIYVCYQAPTSKLRKLYLKWNRSPRAFKSTVFIFLLAVVLVIVHSCIHAFGV